MTRFFTHPVYRTLLALFCCALWGSAFPALKIGYVEFHLTPGDRGGLLIFAGSRFLTASLIIMGAGFLSRGRSFTGSGYGARRTLMILLVIGVLQTTLQYLFFYSGVVLIPGSVSSIVNSSRVFFTMVLAHFYFRDDRFSLRKTAGLILGMGGIIMANRGGGGESFFSPGVLYIMAAALSGAMGGILVKKVSGKISPFFLTGGQMLIGSLLLLMTGIILSPSSTLVLTPGGVILFLYTAFLSASAFVLWNYLLKYNRAGEISLYLFAIPLFGTLLSRLFLKEAVTAGLFLALLLVSGGILMVNLNSLRQKPKI